MLRSSMDMAIYMKNRRQARRDKLIELSGGVCSKCKSVELLEFNHIDHMTKEFVLSGCHLDKSWEKILNEHKKTELLCRTCHLEHTSGLYAAGYFPAWNKNTKQFVCGTMRSYQESKCRCDQCKLAKSMYRMKKVSYTETIPT